MITGPQQLAADLPKLAAWVKRYARDHEDASERLLRAAEHLDRAAEELKSVKDAQ